MRDADGVYLKGRKCVFCGKEFYARCDRSEWAYKTRKKYNENGDYNFFCSWKCLRKFEKERK